MLSRAVLSLARHSRCCSAARKPHSQLLRYTCSTTIERSPRARTAVEKRSLVAAAAVDDPAAAARPKLRRKLFPSEDGPNPDKAQHVQKHDTSAVTTDQQKGQQQQQHEQQQRKEAEEQLQRGWWLHPSAVSELLVYVFWDLDNLHPLEWGDTAELSKKLRDALLPYGRLQQLQAYANSNTLVRQIEDQMDDIRERLQEEADAFRCSICGRRCKSFEDLQKHFKQLHEREHKKKLGGPKKRVKKYVQSEKAARVRDAARMYGTPRKNRSGRKGQMVQVLLKNAGVTVYEVSSLSQAADTAINKHVDNLKRQLAAQEPKPPSPVPLLPTTTAAGQDTGKQLPPRLWARLPAMGSAHACLVEMVKMSESDLRDAWAYLRRMPLQQQKNRIQWSKLWGQLSKARVRAAGADSGAKFGAAPDWLEDAWDNFHEDQQQQEQQQQEQQPSEQQQGEEVASSSSSSSSAAAAAAAEEEEQEEEEEEEEEEEAGELPPWGDRSALQQAVLVIISDDRGFAGTAAQWLRGGAAGVVLITTRSKAVWEQPLLEALKRHQYRLEDVLCMDWHDLAGSQLIGDAEPYDVDDDDEYYDDSDDYQAFSPDEFYLRWLA